MEHFSFTIGKVIGFNPSNKVLEIGGFDGYLRELKMWNQYKSPGEIYRYGHKSPNPVFYPDLIAFYKFDEGLGTSYLDQVTGNSIYVDPTINTPPEWGNPGKELILCDGDAHYS